MNPIPPRFIRLRSKPTPPLLPIRPLITKNCTKNLRWLRNRRRSGRFESLDLTPKFGQTNRLRPVPQKPIPPTMMMTISSNSKSRTSTPATSMRKPKRLAEDALEIARAAGAVKTIRTTEALEVVEIVEVAEVTKTTKTTKTGGVDAAGVQAGEAISSPLETMAPMPTIRKVNPVKGPKAARGAVIQNLKRLRQPMTLSISKPLIAMAMPIGRSNVLRGAGEDAGEDEDGAATNARP